MSLRDRGRANLAFEVDDAVRRVLASWSRERDTSVGRMLLKREAAKLNAAQRAQLAERLAEISLGLLYVLERADT